MVEAGNWTELTESDRPTTRISAPDLAQARRISSGLKLEDDAVSVILDVSVVVAADYRSARCSLTVAGSDESAAPVVRYVGTIDGLTGLIADIEAAGVADGVTLVPTGPDPDSRVLGSDVLRRLQLRSAARAS